MAAPKAGDLPLSADGDADIYESDRVEAEYLIATDLDEETIKAIEQRASSVPSGAIPTPQLIRLIPAESLKKEEIQHLRTAIDVTDDVLFRASDNSQSAELASLLGRHVDS